MPRLLVTEKGTLREFVFEGEKTVSQVLLDHGVQANHPCGGRGTCKKCVMRMEGALSPRTEAERDLPCGLRLSCQAKLLGDAQVWVDEETMLHIQSDGVMPVFSLKPVEGKTGAAVDIGTTTVAVRLIDLAAGRVLGTRSMENPQRSIAADVIGRMEAAMAGKGEVLKRLIRDAVDGMILSMCREQGIPGCDVRVITGNTTMLYLYTGKNPVTLSRAPFEADCLFGCREGENIYPPCMSAFVGADITCALLAADVLHTTDTVLLIDVGTNGEIALWKDGKLLVSATAAGPAFEGGGIEMGLGSVKGAIDRVWVEDGKILHTTIGGEKALGLCGSGIIDAMAALLETEQVDETGAADEDELYITDRVYLSAQDIRSIQLAKGAIAAGIKTLMDEEGVTAKDIDRMYLAGGFGAHLNLQSAAKIGLIPEELVQKTLVLGNAALSGAHMLLLNRDYEDDAKKLCQLARTVNLGGNPAFTENFMECMLFE